MSITLGRLPLGATAAMMGLSMVAACTQGPDIEAYMESTSKAIVASVTSTEDGFVVIHPRQEDGKPDMSVVLGNVLVAAGSGTETKLTLDEPMPAGTSLVAVLYADAGKKGRFEPGIDLPVNVNGSTVRDSFVVK